MTVTEPLRLQRLHHVVVQVPNLDGNLRFLRDFGLTEVPVEAAPPGAPRYWRARGADAYVYAVEQGPQAKLVAIAFAVDQRSELERAVLEHGATAVQPLPGPGGGEVASLVDPDGIRIDLVFGIAGREPDALRPTPVINVPGNRQRLNTPQRYPDGPGNPLRLGHLGLFVKDFQRTEAWYCGVLNLRASDRMHMGGGGHFVGGFYRLNRGGEWVDHHILGFFAMGKSGVHHMSFEVQDLEQQMVSHRHLQKAAHQPVWGVGRHPLGSHVFDMWKDPNGLRFETFSDTDWCNNELPAKDHAVEGSEMDLWSNDSAERYFA